MEKLKFETQKRNPIQALEGRYNGFGRPRFRDGVASVMAMMFLVLLTTLGLAMFYLSTLNTQAARSLADAAKARAAAESGMRWIAYRFAHMNRPKTSTGQITASVAAGLWPSITNAVSNDLATLTNSSERPVALSGGVLTTAPIAVDETQARFTVTMRQHPTYSGDSLDARSIAIMTTGTCGLATRTISMDFTIDKKVKFAVIGKVEMQLGKNTLVEGNVAVGTPNYYPPSSPSATSSI